MTTAELQWLPKHHLGVEATLSHVDELIEQVGEILFEYQSQLDGIIGIKEIAKGSVSQSVIDWIAPIPRKIPLLVADALVALRAAVEHTLFAEAEFLNGGPLDEKLAKSIEMPARLTYEDFAEWVKRRPRDAPAAIRKGGEILRRVELLQPYHRNVRPDLHPMALLASHTNHAKHRNPAITAVRLVALVREDKAVPRSIQDLPMRDEVPLRVGEVIAETPFGAMVPVTLFPSIGINRPGSTEWPILMRELDEIAYWVRTQAVPRLITGGEPPKEPLPIRYEIAVGHTDERRAISLGSQVTATERNKRRLGAASARGSLADLVLSLPDAPDRLGVESWLDSLADDEILERVSRPKAASSCEPGLMQANLAAIQELHDESVRFVGSQAN